jgi:acetyltransferase-like isoleucine patch superfamily enzyme
MRAAYLRWRGSAIGANTKVRVGSRIYGFEHLEIGGDCSLSQGANISLGPGSGRMVMGNGTIVGPDCYFRNANHKFESLDIPIAKQGHDSKDIRIGSHAWIGARCVLLGGTNIGDYAILGAGSVVSFEIPPYAIAVGNPARVIKRRPNAPPLPAAASPDTAE